MAVLASALLGLIILLPCSSASAGDLFTGVRLDNDEQYFAYLGLNEDLPWKPLGVETFVQLFVTGQSYIYEDQNVDIEANVQSLTPSLGVTKIIGGGPWSVTGLLGAELKWGKESPDPGNLGHYFESGVFVQAEAMYSKETHNLHAIVSYADRDQFWFGRIRGNLRTYLPETGCCPVFVGLELGGMDSRRFEFNAVQVGALVEVPFGRFSLLAHAGFREDSDLGSGGYGGLELYTSF